MVDCGTSNHKARIDSSTNNATQWIPCAVVKPIVKIIEPLFSQVFGCSIVKVRIKLVYHTLIAKHGKQPDGECYEKKKIILGS